MRKYFDLFPRKDASHYSSPLDPNASSNLIGFFPCDGCGKVYNRKGNLIRHMRYECGKEPQFCCHICDKKYFRSDKLAVHTKLHMSHPI